MTEVIEIYYGYVTEYLGVGCVWAKFIPWLLIQKQKENHLSMASELFEYVETNEDFLKNITTDDETCYMVMTRKLSSRHHTVNSLHCYNGEKHTICTSKPNWCCTRVLYKISMLYKVRLLTRISVYKCWNISLRQCIVTDCRSGHLVSGKFTCPFIPVHAAVLS